MKYYSQSKASDCKQQLELIKRHEKVPKTFFMTS